MADFVGAAVGAHAAVVVVARVVVAREPEGLEAFRCSDAVVVGAYCGGLVVAALAVVEEEEGLVEPLAVQQPLVPVPVSVCGLFWQARLYPHRRLLRQLLVCALQFYGQERAHRLPAPIHRRNFWPQGPVRLIFYRQDLVWSGG